MNIRYFAAIFFLLMTAFFSVPAFSLATMNQQIQSTGEIIYPTPAPNLAVIPDAWLWGYYGDVPQYVFFDYNVTRNGPSIRLQKGGGIDPFGLLDRSTWTNMPQFGFSVRPGDHIVARAWMKTDPSSTGNTVQGVRIGVDLYGSGNIVDGYPGTHITDRSEWVHWGASTWTMRQYDFIIPSKTYTEDQTGRVISPTQINMIVMWTQAYPADDNGNVWIADAELYINPSFTSTAPPPVPQNVQIAVSVPQNVQIAVSRVTASSYSYGHPPGLAVDGIESPNNYWGTDAGVPEGRVPQWLRLDLGSVHRINTVTTHFYDGSVRTYTYYIQVSNDSSSWTTIVPARRGSGSVTDTFSQVGARFVRITITANTANPAAHIEETKVYGFS